MPELPEVEIIKRGLLRLIVGKKIVAVESDNPKSFPNPPSEVEQFLYGSTITDVRRRAKVLLIDISTAYTLVIHLKMTGQLVFVGGGGWKVEGGESQSVPYPKDHPPVVTSEARFGGGHPTDSLISHLPDKSTRVTIEFGDGSHLYFNDQRKFGWMRLMPTILVPEIDFMKRVGPEPLEDGFTSTDFIQRIRRRSGSTVKAAILDQTTLAGVGNIYADESLWGAKIHPATRVKEISDAQLAKLLEEIKYVLKLSIEKGGSTDRNYVNAEGKRGSYIDFARVFRKEGQPCTRCGTTILKTRVASRGTHICPACQVLE